jgi:hypothetical protein
MLEMTNAVGRLPDREKTAPGQREIVLINKDLLSETLEDRERPADPFSA